MTEKLPNVRIVLRLIIDPGWAPVLVAASFLALSGTELASKYDYVFHTLGGAAFAFFFWRAAALVPSVSQRLSRNGRSKFALAGACAVALLWELAEFGADRMLGTTLQHGLVETLRDLAFGVLGAILLLAVTGLSRRDGSEDRVDSADDKQ